MTLSIKSLVAVGGLQCINLKDSMEKSLILEGRTEQPPLSSRGKEGKLEAALGKRHIRSYLLQEE